MFPQGTPSNLKKPLHTTGNVIHLVPDAPIPQPRKKALLSAKDVENAKPKAKLYRLFDAEGLYLEITPAGGRYWRMKYYVHGRERRLALGKFPEISLAEARERKFEARKQLAHGIDPYEAKKEQERQVLLGAANTFELVAREWHTLNTPKWTPSYAEDILHRMEMDIFPKIGRLPIAGIRPTQVLDALRKIERRGAHEMARRARQYCGQIFQYAIITERAEGNPAQHLNGALAPFKRGHFAAIEADDLPDFLRALERNDARLYRHTRHALRLMMLTFVRTGELIGAKWEEFNFESKVWTIPAERMKKRRPHIVPLSRQAIEILTEQKNLTGKWEWVFPNQAHPRKHMSNGTILKALERLGYKGKMTGHGFRSLALSAIKEKLGYRHEVPDRQLAHVPNNKVDLAYDRAKFIDERHKMMQDWADYLDGVLGNAACQAR